VSLANVIDFIEDDLHLIRENPSGREEPDWLFNAKYPEYINIP